MSACDEYINEIPNKGNDAVERGKTIANGLVALMGINLMQACAIVGYCMKESSCRPEAVNKAEAAGTSSISSAYANSAGSYGAGFAQWTGRDSKNSNLAAIGVAAGTPIESLSMDQQIQMYAKGGLGKKVLSHGLAKCNNWDSAVACACLEGHGVGRAQECYDLVGGNVNDPKYVEAARQQWPPGGPYTAHCAKASGDPKALSKAKKWAQQVYAAMGGVVGDYNGTGTADHQWPDFNLKEFPIYQDEQGRYTEEPIGWGIANHLRISSGGAGEGGMFGNVDANGVLAYAGSWGSLTSIGQQVIANANTHTIMLPGSRMYGQTLGAKGQRCCTSGPAGWYSKAGIQLGWGWTRSGGVAVDCNLSRFGFVKLWEGKMGYGNPPDYQPADVVAIYTTQAAHQHGVMWTGTEWLSDYIQKVAMCGTGYASMETKSQLWRHPRCWSNPPV